MLSPNKNKFDGLERKDVVFHTVVDHKLWTSILTSERAQERSRVHVPVLVFWHGGGFVTGDRMYEPWWPEWLLELASSQGAMTISPDFRLFPEATGADIYDDMNAFWTWLLDTLPTIAESESWSVRPDVDRILCVGQSSGGRMAVQSAFGRAKTQIKAIVSLCAPLCSEVPQLTVPRPRMIGGTWPPPPRQAEAKIRSYIKSTKGTTRTVGNPTDMWELVALDELRH